MRFSESLKKNNDFRRLYAKGKSAATPLVVVYYRRTGNPGNRVGITVSNKIGKAVIRNRVRRRLREIYRRNEQKLRRGMDVVMVARVRSRFCSFWELEAAYLSACRSLGILAEETEQEGRI